MLLSSHILSEVEKPSDRISIIRGGRIVDSGALADLRHLTRTRVHAVTDRRTSLERSPWPRRPRRAVDGTDVRLSGRSKHLGDSSATLGDRGVASLTCQPPPSRSSSSPATRRSGCRGSPPSPRSRRARRRSNRHDHGHRPTGRVAPSISLGTRLAGFSHLLRLAWRRDRILIPSSVLGLVILAIGSAQATLALYPTDEAASTGLASVLTNPRSSPSTGRSRRPPPTPSPSSRR